MGSKTQVTHTDLEDGLLKRSRLVQNSYEDNQRIMWKEAKILGIKTGSIYRKHKEAVCMSFTTTQQPAHH